MVAIPSNTAIQQFPFNYKLKLLFSPFCKTVCLLCVNSKYMHIHVVKVKMLITFLFDIYYRPHCRSLLRSCCLLFMSYFIRIPLFFNLVFKTSKICRDWNKPLGNSFLNFIASSQNKCVGYDNDAVFQKILYLTAGDHLSPKRL